MHIEIDISGNMKFLYKDSVMAFSDKDGSMFNTVFLSSKLKREIFSKYKNKIVDLKDQMHCIMIYYCIKDYINKISRMKICPDISPNKIHHYLELYFSNDNVFLKIKKRIRSVKHSSKVHKIAYLTYQKKMKPNSRLSKRMVVKMLRKEA